MNTPNNEKVNASKRLVTVLIKEFRKKYPSLDFKKLIATTPYSLLGVDLSQKRMAQIGLHPVVLSTICGTTFGDSNLAIQTRYANARLSYRHSTRQSDWFFWKTFCVFQDFTTEDSVQFQLPDGYQADAVIADGECIGKLKLSTKVDKKLTQLRDIIAPPRRGSNTKTIERNWLNHMNNYFLMTLWLDDGGLTGGLGREGVISTGAMPMEQAKILADYITTVWDIRCEARELSEKMKNDANQSRIFVKDQDNLMRLLRIIAPIIPVESMLYKVCFFPNDVSLQQRWASELKTLVRAEWHDTLDKIYQYKTIKYYSNRDL